MQQLQRIQLLAWLHSNGNKQNFFIYRSSVMSICLHMNRINMDIQGKTPSERDKQMIDLVERSSHFTKMFLYIHQQAAWIMSKINRNNWNIVQCQIKLQCDKIIQRIKQVSSFAWKNMKKISISIFSHNLFDKSMKERCLIQLSKARWPNLEQFTFNCAVIGVQAQNACFEGFEQLMKGDWPHLTLLSLPNLLTQRYNLTNFSHSKFKQLNDLNLSGNRLSRRGIKQLVRCNFIQLMALNLSFCKLDDECLIQLSKGTWKILFQLGLQDQDMNYSNRGIRYLINGNWPSLEMLISYGLQITQCVRTMGRSNWSRIKVDRINTNSYFLIQKYFDREEKICSQFWIPKMATIIQ